MMRLFRSSSNLTSSNLSADHSSDDGSRAVPLNAPAVVEFPSNFIRTSKYTLITFLPINLFEQFRRLANAYFLLTIFIQIIPDVTPFPLYTSIIPLVIILATSAIKEAFEDYNRHKQDFLANNRGYQLVSDPDRAPASGTVGFAQTQAAAADAAAAPSKPAGGSVRSLKKPSNKRVASDDHEVEIEMTEPATVDDANGNGVAKSVKHHDNDDDDDAAAADDDHKTNGNANGKRKGSGGSSGSGDPRNVDVLASVMSDDELDRKFKTVSSKDIKVGMILRIRRDEEFPADIVLLSSSHPDATAFVNTANLDGEAVPKVRVAPQCTLHAVHPERVKELKGQVKAEPPNPSLYHFQGRLELDPETLRGGQLSHLLDARAKGAQSKAANMDKAGRFLFPIGDQQLLLRGSKLVNTDWIYGLVVYTGFDTKLMLNRNPPMFKFSSFERRLNKFVLFLFVVNFFVCILLSAVFSLRDQSFSKALGVAETSGLSWLLNFCTQYILFSFMIPMSLYVTIELVKVGQAAFMQWDVRMQHEDLNGEIKGMTVKSSSLNEELGCIEYIFSDKTGTLTQNKMELNAVSCDNELYFERSEAERTALEAQGRSANEETANADGHKMVSQLIARGFSETPEQRDERVRGKPNYPREFLLDILLCNSVLPSKKEAKITSHVTKSGSGGAAIATATATAVGQPKLMTRSQSDDEFIDVTPVTPELSAHVTGSTAASAASASASRAASFKQQWLFQSLSPDEVALCEACCRYGLVMRERKGNTITVSYELPADVASGSSATPSVGEDGLPVTNVVMFKYTIMAVLDFTSTRARMSVVMRMPEGDYRLYVKGADSTVLKLLKQEKSVDGQPTWTQRCSEHVEQFASTGSRTLMYAYRVLSVDEFNHWEKTYQQAVNALDDREALVELAFEEIEHSMHLLGCTGVEDQLQEYVPETIDYMIKAGVRVIVLTGDKKETAVTIAKQSQLIQSDFEVIFAQGKTKEDAGQSLRDAIAQMESIQAQEEINHRPQPFALSIDGLCMEICLKHYREDFIRLFKACRTIVSYRSTPRQKALCVGMAKNDLQACCLAVGDGANDVSMIQEANVGIGILGKEGAHAAMSSDYVIHRFYHLMYLIFIHGRYNFYRTAKVVFFAFYKNLVFPWPQILFEFWSMNTGQTLFISLLMSGYNLLFTSLPPLFVGVYEKDVPDYAVLARPESFAKFKSETIFNFRHFFAWLLTASWHGVVLFLCIYLPFAESDSFASGRTLDLWSFGSFVFLGIILLCNIKMVTALDYITSYSLIAAGLGPVLYLICMMILSLAYMLSINADAYPVLQVMFTSNMLWAYLALTVALGYWPTLSMASIQALYYPSYAQLMRVLVGRGKLKELPRGEAPYPF